MKRLLLLIGILTIFCFAKCKKDKTDFNGLPPATQSGKNTFGFLLNGQPWTPEGYNGNPNLSMYYDETFSGGVFNYTAYKLFNTATGYYSQQISLFGDSIRSPQKIFLPSKTKFGMIFKDDITGCRYSSSDSTVKILSGYFDIRKLDKTNGIFSAQFEITITNINCDTIRITAGRLDTRY